MIKREIAVAVAVVLYIVGLLLMPGNITELMKGESGHVMGIMYVSYGMFVFPAVVISVIFDDKNTARLTLSFYWAVTVLFTIFSFHWRDYLPSAIILVITMVVATFLVRTDPSKQ